MDMTAYPEEPWRLNGHAIVSVGLSPSADIDVAPGVRLVKIFGRALIACAFFVYTPPSPLTYNEVMVATVVRRGLRPYVHIKRIWVDSVASRNGGRDLWAIPKELAEFDIATDQRYTAKDIAAFTVRQIGKSALRLPVRFTILQIRNGQAVTAPLAGKIALTRTKVAWQFHEALDNYANFWPLVSLRIRRFRLRFGRDSKASSAGLGR